MQLFAFVALLLVAQAAAEQPQEVSNAQPVQSGQPQASAGPAQVMSSQAGPVPSEQPSAVHHVHGGQSYPGEHHTHEHHQGPAHYAPAGIIQLVGAESGKPQMMRQYAAPVEQYGQPESASIPANYKPFGSWGLYIGGNPADGYYSNYYKALSNSVDKQQVGVEQAVKPAAGPVAVGQASAFGPVMKQASSYPYSSYQDQVHPFDYYTPADLNSGSRVAVSDSPVGPSVYSSAGASRFVSPVQMGAQVYGSHSTFGNPEHTLSYADSYSTKRFGSLSPSSSSSSSSSSAFSQKPESQVQVPAKGYQQQQYSYASYSPAVVGQQAVYQSQPQPQPHGQVVAYPVPVGSQIVGSQPGVEGSFQPYGVHGFTRYAIKPTVVGSEHAQYHNGVHSSPASQFPVYKQQQQQQQHHQQSVYQPMSFYGYPLSQLHYSQQGPIVPAFGQQQAGVQSVGPVSGNSQVMSVQPDGMASHSPVGGNQVEAASSEKSESEVEKSSAPSVNKQQKRA